MTFLKRIKNLQIINILVSNSSQVISADMTFLLTTNTDITRLLRKEIIQQNLSVETLSKVELAVHDSQSTII